MTAEKQKSKISKNLAIPVAILAAIFLIGGAYLARGWIRGPLLTWYVELVYLPKVERAFDQDFKEITPKLAALGLTFNTQHGNTNKAASCQGEMYEGFGLSKGCQKLYHSDNPDPAITSSYREQWRQESPALESYLLDNGWTKTWNAAQPIDELLIRDDRGVSVGVNYEKHHGKIVCRLSIWYNGPEQEPAYNTFNALQSCSRHIEFFGGY